MQLYTEPDFAATKKTMGVRLAILGVMMLIVLGAAIVFVTALRNELAVIIAAILGSALCYTFLSIKVMPWVRYWMYQNDMRHGLSRETDAWFVSCSDSTRISDGVAFHEFIVRVGDEEDDERLFFWDDDKQLPALKEGQMLHIRSFGNYITELDIEE